MRDIEVPITDGQQGKLRAYFEKTRRPVSLVLIEDGQSPRALLAAIVGLRAGSSLSNDQIEQRGACLNLAGFYDARVALLDRFEQSAHDKRVVVLHMGADTLDEYAIDLLRYLLHEQFDTGPEVVLAAEKLDFKSNRQHLSSLFGPDRTLDLTFGDPSSAEWESNAIDLLKKLGTKF